VDKEQEGVTRREIVKKAIFVAPIVLTLPAAASFAQAGSGGPKSGQRNPPPRWGRRRGDD
jgi:hypothetical protein